MKRIFDTELRKGNVDHSLLTLCQNVNKLLRSVGDFARGATLLERALNSIENTDLHNSVDGANLFRQLGDIQRNLNDFAAAGAALEKAQRIYELEGILETPDGALLMQNLGSLEVERGELDKAAVTLELGKSIARKIGMF